MKTAKKHTKEVEKNKIVTRLTADHRCAYDLDLDPMALILFLDLDIMKMYLSINSEFCGSMHSKVRGPNRTHGLFAPVTVTLYIGK